MFLPVPFQSYFSNILSKADDESLSEDFDAFHEHILAKIRQEPDVSSTQDETEVSSLIWEDESRKQTSLTVEEAEKYTNYLDSESLVEPIRLLPFVSIDLHDVRDRHSSIAGTTQTLDDDEEFDASRRENYEIWWGVEGTADALVDRPGSPTVESLLGIDSSSEENISSNWNTEGSSVDDKSLDYSAESGRHRAIGIPRTIEFYSDQDTTAISRDNWLFDPVETLVLEKIPLTDENDVYWVASSRLQELLIRHVELHQSETTNQNDTENLASNICAILDEHPQIAQVRYNIALICQEDCEDHYFINLKGKTSCSSLYYPIFIFCATGHLQGVRSSYEAFPEAIGHVDKRLGTPLHYACYNGESVSVVEFLLDRYPEAARVTNRHHQSPLHMACAVHSFDDGVVNAQLRIVELLLECFPTAARLADENGYTPLHMACKVGASVDVLAALAQSSTGVLQLSTRTLEKPLHVAASQSKCSDTVRFLLSKDPSQAAAMDASMQTPLHKACMTKVISTEIVCLLVNVYPNALTMRDDNIETPWDIAIRLGNSSADVLRILGPQ